MTRALIDTNVIIDALAAREPFREDAEKIFLLAAEDRFAGYVTASSVTDIYYLVRKYVDAAQSRAAIRNLLEVFSIIGVTAEDCDRALFSPLADYEDALVATCAAKAKVDCIVSRDASFLGAKSPVPVVTPQDFLSHVALLQ